MISNTWTNLFKFLSLLKDSLLNQMYKTLLLRFNWDSLIVLNFTFLVLLITMTHSLWKCKIWSPRLDKCVKAPSLSYGNLRGFKPTRGRKLIANACNLKPFEPGEWGLRVVLSGHFCASFLVGHARRSRPALNYRNISGSPDHNKNNNNPKSDTKDFFVSMWHVNNSRVAF